jgi:hypothetical protein
LGYQGGFSEEVMLKLVSKWRVGIARRGSMHRDLLDQVQRLMPVILAMQEVVQIGQ